MTRIGLMGLRHDRRTTSIGSCGVTAIDAWLQRSKIEVARRLVIDNATSPRSTATVGLSALTSPRGSPERESDQPDRLRSGTAMAARGAQTLLAYSDIIPGYRRRHPLDTFEDGPDAQRDCD